MHAHGKVTITSGGAWTLLVLGSLVTMLIVYIAGLVVFRVNLLPDIEAQPAPRPVPAATSTATPRPPIVPGTPTPTSCDQLYSPEMMARFGDLVLNPGWSAGLPVGVAEGAQDPQLVGVITSTTHLTCRWAAPDAPGDTGLDTSVVWVTPEQTTAVTTQLTALGFDCFEERAGVRCVSETDSGGLLVGESHFLRDGLWLATRYTNIAPAGYTHDIIDTLWGPA